MPKILSLIILMAWCAITSAAQIFTSSPVVLQESSKNVVLTYHADSPLGNNGLKGLTASTPVYAHIGVITNKSDGAWKYAPNWLDNSAKYQLTYVGTDTWTLTLGDMRTYFGITDADEHIRRIAVVLRDATGNRTGRTSSGGDIFVDVLEEGFQMLFTSDASSTVITSAQKITFTASTSAPANITIALNGNTLSSATNATSATGSYTFSSYGSYDVTATATAAGQTVRSTITVVFPEPSKPGTYPGGTPVMGAVKNADGSVTFCLAAPGKSSVVLVPSWDDYKVLGKNSMLYQDYNGQRYFFTTVSGLDDTTDYMYYYLVDGSCKVGDPYARLVLDPYSDKWIDSSVWPGMPAYPYDKFDDTMLAVYRGNADSDFKFSPFEIPDHRNLVIYELLIRDFTGTEGQAYGTGTYAEAMKKIPYLRELGVNAVEILPVMEFSGNNSWGYNPNFYFAPDKAYGSPADLKLFVERCHQSGIAVILDIAFNHSDGLHPWYQMYPPSSNPFYNETAPHEFSVLNDWKQENPLVRRQWKDCLQYWMTAYNVDGYRFDLVKGLGTSYPSGTSGYNASRVAVMKDLHDAIRAVKPNGIHINENLAEEQEENEMAADGQINWCNQNYISAQYAKGDAKSSNLIYYYAQSCSRTPFSTVAYAESHDEERVAFIQKNDKDSKVKTSEATRYSRLAQMAVQLLLTPGPKMIWQFGELGNDQTTKNADYSNNTDPKIVDWNRLNDSYPAELHQLYRTLCHLRLDNPDLFGADATFNTYGFGDNLTSARIMRLQAGTKEVIAFINPRLSGASLACNSTSAYLKAGNSQLIAAGSGFTPTLTNRGSGVSVSVPANSFAVFATTNTVDVIDGIVDAAPAVKVIGGEGSIAIVGSFTQGTVTSMSGISMPVAPGTETVTGLAPGLYIVSIDGTAHKTLVR